MSAPVDLSLSLRPAAGPASPAAALAARVRTVLETRPGRLPWLPEFGCDLEGLIGSTTEQSRLAEARMRVASALRRWVPGVRIVRCDLSLSGVARADADPRVPVAERALGSQALSARLEIHLVLETEHGPIDLEAELAPPPPTRAP